MTNTKRRPVTIVAFPRPVARPLLRGLCLTEGTVIALTVKNDGEEKMFVGLRFARNGKEQTIVFDDPIHVSWLSSLSSPSCCVDIELDDENISFCLNAEPLEIYVAANLSTLTEFMEKLDDSQPDEERFEGSAEQ